jgi:hypothetical protein
MGWLFRKSRNLLGVRWTVSKTQGRDPRLTASKKVGPFSFNNRGRVSISAFGFTKTLRKARR